jgi:Tfp pilus assembly protein PilV
MGASLEKGQSIVEVCLAMGLLIVGLTILTAKLTKSIQSEMPKSQFQGVLK